MAHHAYFISAEQEQGIERALAHAQRALGFVREQNPDLTVLRYGLFSVDDARKLADIAERAPVQGDQKMIVVSALRFFHEAQNALLKLFEEPPQGTTLVLVIPAEGMLLATLRSRLQPLPHDIENLPTTSPEVTAFIKGSSTEREKSIAKLLDRAKSDKDEEKQRARNEALQLVEGLMRAAYAQRTRPGMTELLTDLTSFLPILHERSAPLKQIFEHLLLVVPKDLAAR